MAKFKSQQGQILLIVTLTMIIALTVGLSIISRTITEQKISKQNEESQRAYRAAEAGIEQAIKQTQEGTITESLSNLANYSTSIQEARNTDFLLNGRDFVSQDGGFDIWLSDYPNFTSPYTGDITLYWGESNQTQCTPGQGNSTTPALEIILLSGTKTAPVISKYFYDGCSSRASSSSAGSPSAGGTVDGVVFSYSATIPAGDLTSPGGLIMKVIPVYNSAKIGIVSNPPTLPNQGFLIESTGKSGDTTRKIVYFNSYPQTPLEVFQYGILSP